MKAGTTWLYTQLKDHPDIYFTPEKEIHYFANVVGIENQLSYRNRLLKFKEKIEQYHDKNAKEIAKNMDELFWYAVYARPERISNEWYESLFQLNKSKKYSADFSNLYCQMDSNGWENVRKVAKNIKVIYTLRDPLERLWSHYKFHMKWVNREDEALDAGFENFKDLLEKHWFWINAEYADNYKRLKENLNDDELMILYFEDFRADPTKMLLEIQKFLGIRELLPQEEMLKKKVNTTKDFDLPIEWYEYMRTKLKPLAFEMKKEEIWNDRWNNIE